MTKCMERQIIKLITNLKEWDKCETYPKDNKIEKIKNKLIFIGKPAVPLLIDVLNNYDTWSCFFAADILGKIRNKKAIGPLVDALEETELGENASEALKNFGLTCIPAVIKKLEYRIAHPIEEKGTYFLATTYILSTIGEIRCKISIKFLNKLLDDYMSKMPDEEFDPMKHNWKYKNIDFFLILDCMVKQQDKIAIPHIKKAMGFFEKEYVEYKVCQIAIGRIKKGVSEGYLPLEAIDIAVPTGPLLKVLSGGELGGEDNFDEKDDEYFEEDEEF